MPCVRVRDATMICLSVLVRGRWGVGRAAGPRPPARMHDAILHTNYN